MAFHLHRPRSLSALPSALEAWKNVVYKCSDLPEPFVSGNLLALIDI